MKQENNNNKKYYVMVMVFVTSIVLLGVSLSYAYFSINFSGKNDIPIEKSANLNVTSDLEVIPAINASELSLIEPNEYRTKGEKIVFKIKNNDQAVEKDGKVIDPSNVNAKYIIKITDMSLSKNLFSKYFKWALVINPCTNGVECDTEQVISGSFARTTYENPEEYPDEGTTIVVPKDEQGGYLEPSAEDIISIPTKTLMTSEQQKLLKIGEEDTVEFYIWLENSSTDDQIYLTNGLFKGTLAIDAVPTREGMN